MDIEEIARAMYEAPAPDETEGAVWPPGHPEDVGWWMSRAAALMPLVRRAQASKVREIADRALDPRDGIPFNADHDLAIVSAWLDEAADRIEQNSEGNET
jgi:hypothetical protein